MDTTTIQVSIPVYQALNSRKQPGDSFDDVLRRELALTDENTPDPDGRPREADQNDTTPTVDVPNSVPQTVDTAKAREAIDAAAQFVCDQQGAVMSEIVVGVMPKCPCGYDADADVARIEDSDRRNRSTWWRKIVRPGLQSHPDVTEPPLGASEWRPNG